MFPSVDPTIPSYSTISPAAVGTSMATQVALVLALSAFVFGAIIFKFGYRAVFNALGSALGIASKATKAKV